MPLREDFTIIISRVDALGDMILTIPMAGILKTRFPKCRIYYLARKYTEPVVALSHHIDGFIEYDHLADLAYKDQITFLKSFNADIFINVFPKKNLAFLAKKAGIPLRAGTTNRWYHWLSCNRLIRLSRKRSSLHEAQLNIRLLRFLPLDTDISFSELHSFYGIKEQSFLPFPFLPSDSAKAVILHPKSNGSGKEWSIENYARLIRLLHAEAYTIVVCGLPREAESIMPLLERFPFVINAIGRLDLREYILLMNQSYALVASGTGPLHIAAMMGIKAIGLFPQRKAVGPQRWRPVGAQAFYLTADYVCPKCESDKDCDCINTIAPERVKEILTAL